MNARMLPTFIRLLGKLVMKYNILSDVADFDETERDILRLAKTEYDFYHSHERVEAPESNDVSEKSGSKSAGKRTLRIEQAAR